MKILDKFIATTGYSRFEGEGISQPYGKTGLDLQQLLEKMQQLQSQLISMAHRRFT